MVPGPAASTLPRSLLEIQDLGPHPGHLSLNLHFNRITCIFKFEKHGLGHISTHIPESLLASKREGSWDLGSASATAQHRLGLGSHSGAQGHWSEPSALKTQSQTNIAEGTLPSPGLLSPRSRVFTSYILFLEGGLWVQTQALPFRLTGFCYNLLGASIFLFFQYGNYIS